MSTHSQIHISSMVYRKFYDLLLEKFIDKELTQQEQKRYFGYAPYKMWEVKDDKGNSKFRNLFGGDRHELYFYSKLSSDSEKTPYVSLKVETFTKALKYLDFQIPNNLTGVNEPPPEIRAGILYQFFVEKHFPKFFKDHINELKIYDDRTQEIINNRKKNSTNTSITKPIADVGSSNIEETAINVLINKYYGFITDAKYEDAWALLSPSFQKRVWDGEFEKFKLGYTYTLSIHSIHIFDIVNKGSDTVCKVYYEDNVVTYSSYDLSKLNKITVSQVDDFSKQIKSLHEVASTIGMKNFDSIELHKFFEPAISDYIWYTRDFDPKRIGELLPSPETITVPRLYHITCTMIDDVWLIKGINAIKTYLLR